MLVLVEDLPNELGLCFGRAAVVGLRDKVDKNRCVDGSSSFRFAVIRRSRDDGVAKVRGADDAVDFGENGRGTQAAEKAMAVEVEDPKGSLCRGSLRGERGIVGVSGDGGPCKPLDVRGDVGAEDGKDKIAVSLCS